MLIRSDGLIRANSALRALMCNRELTVKKRPCGERTLPRACGLLVGLTLFAAIGFAGAEETPDGIRFFEERIRPVLVEHCYECHSSHAPEIKGGLRLDSRQRTRAGGDSGEAVVPGDIESSLLLAAMKYEGPEMPPDRKLSAVIIADFEQWIRMGAPDPRDDPSTLSSPEPDYSESRDFWSFQPVKIGKLPEVHDGSWPRTLVDNFILAKLEANGLAPAPAADRVEWIRRVYFDLIGLPPTPAQIDAFVSDAAPGAYERLVDRLLASPHYGERWAQHWLDVVRYAETEGFEYDRTLPGAWRYRDYVIRAFNSDKPYTCFLQEQLAGDECGEDDHERLVAAGFHRLGAVRRNAGNQEVAGSRNEVLTERTDIVGAAILGLTVGCARCHDHKFDPIPQKDYYRLQAYFAATREFNLALASDEEQTRWKAETEQIQHQIEELKTSLATQTGDAERKTTARIAALTESLPPPLPTICSVRNFPDKETPIHVLRRGDWSLPGERVGPHPLGVLASTGTAQRSQALSRPRTELANWLTDPAHPLTSRVMVNRIWQYHFGRGLVATANDFGQNGQRPSHPALLDRLAHEFVAGNWQLKPLHRLILLSSTYRQSARSPHFQRGEAIDPDNALLWRFNRRRLSAEEIRDAMLSVSGRLNRRAGGRSVIVPVDQQLIDQLYKPSQWEVTPEISEHWRRSVYLIAKRNLKLPFMEVFDQPPLQTSCSRREQSTHAPQSLELLNGQLSNELADTFAERLQAEAGDNRELQVELAYRLATGRGPTPKEQRLARQFLTDVPLREFALAMFNLNSFLYVH